MDVCLITKGKKEKKRRAATVCTLYDRIPYIYTSPAWHEMDLVQIDR